MFPLLGLFLIMAWVAWRCADEKNKPALSSGLSSRNKLEDRGRGLEDRGYGLEDRGHGLEDGPRPGPGMGVLIIGETEEAEDSLVSSLQPGHNSIILSLGDPILQVFNRGISTI